MMHHLTAAAALGAMIATATAPATAAAPVPPRGPASLMVDASAMPDMTQRHGRYRYRYRRGPDVGDILTGVLIIGAIAAVADAVRPRDDRRYREPDDRRYPERDWQEDDRDDTLRGIDGAVDRCLGEIERDERVEQVDRADRTARGWQIEGRLASGARFTCSLGPDGRIERIDTDEQDGGYGRRYDHDNGYDGTDYGRGNADDDGRYDERTRDDGTAQTAYEDRQYDDRYAAQRRRMDDARTRAMRGDAYPSD